MNDLAKKILAISDKVEYELKTAPGVTVFFRRLSVDEAKSLEAVSKKHGITPEGEGDIVPFMQEIAEPYILDEKSEPVFHEADIGKFPVAVITEIFTEFMKVNEVPDAQELEKN